MEPGSSTISKTASEVTANLLMIQIPNRFCWEAHTTKVQARKQLSTNFAGKQGAFGDLSQLITAKCILGIQVQLIKEGDCTYKLRFRPFGILGYQQL